MEAAATVSVPLTRPSEPTVPFPLTSLKTPFTRARPAMLAVFSRMLEARESSAHSPARVPSVSRACSGGAVIGPDGACMIASLSRRADMRCHLVRHAATGKCEPRPSPAGFGHDRTPPAPGDRPYGFLAALRCCRTLSVGPG